MTDTPDQNDPIEAAVSQRLFREPRMDLNGKRILVTGGTGSFGKKLAEIVCREFKPKEMIIFSRDELKQYEMAQEFSPQTYPFLRYMIGDVRDFARVEQAMKDVDIVLHAAALKHVPIAEFNPFECIKTNVHGAENVSEAAIRHGVKHVLALSSDKAANPVNLYGASKLASDKIFTAAQNRSGPDGPVFSVVRYGNVVASRGSVIPFFRKLIADGADHLPITDPRMTRFWITLDQGVNFVLSSLAMARGGEIFIPKLPSMSTVDLARALAPSLPHRIVGIRPGEKLHEVMVPVDEAHCTVELDDRFAILPGYASDLMARYLGDGAHRTPDGFGYSSDNNPEQLSPKALRKLIQIAA